jgi:hypothetical protein
MELVDIAVFTCGVESKCDRSSLAPVVLAGISLCYVNVGTLDFVAAGADAFAHFSALVAGASVNFAALVDGASVGVRAVISTSQE